MTTWHVPWESHQRLCGEMLKYSLGVDYLSASAREKQDDGKSKGEKNHDIR